VIFVYTCGEGPAKRVCRKLVAADSEYRVYHGYSARLPGGVAYTPEIVRCNLKCDEELESLGLKLISLRTNLMN